MRKSYLWAAVITVAIIGWFLSGDLIVGGQNDGEVPEGVASEDATGIAEETAAQSQQEAPFQVRVRTITAEERVSQLTARGRTVADDRVTLRAQTAGLVENIAVSRGQLVEAGEVICEIEEGSRAAQKLRAEASLAQAELNHTAATRLNEKGYAAETRLRAAKAELDAAKAALADAELDIRRTRIRASFDGVVESISAERGTLLNIGDPCAEVVASDPMLVTAQVSERDVGQLEVGMPGEATLVTGQTAKGEIGYISPSADPATRTFRIELVVDNADAKLRDGVTAEIAVPLQGTEAHRFSAAILTLDDEGRVGVRTVDEDDTVRFLPVEILSDTGDGVWVSGLPKTVTVITVGQEYVADGERVAPVVETAGAQP